MKTNIYMQKFIRQLSVLFVILIAIIACKKNDSPKYTTSDIDYILFGTFAGECGGEQCIEIYKMQASKLFEDTTDTYPGAISNPTRTYNLLEDSVYQKVKYLKDSIRSEILNDTSKVFGCPDCHDQGGVYIKIYLKNGQAKEFKIDRVAFPITTSAMPNYASTLSYQIEQAVFKINY